MSGLARAVDAAAATVDAEADRLNELDAHAGDGDLGVTMRIAAAELRAVLPGLAGEPPATVLAACGQALVRKAPSTSGTLIGSALLAAARTAGESPGGDADEPGRLLTAAYEAMIRLGRAGPGAKTMLDALGPAATAACEVAAAGGDSAAALRAAAEAADAGARATRGMVPRHGRAGWLAERSTGHEDAGARLIAVVLAATVNEHYPA